MCVINSQLTFSILTANEIYLIIKPHENNVVERTLMTRSEVFLIVKNVVN